MKPNPKNLLLFLALVLPWMPARAEDIVDARDGRSYRGKIVEKDSAAVILELQDGAPVRLQRSEILRIRYGANDKSLARDTVDADSMAFHCPADFRYRNPDPGLKPGNTGWKAPVQIAGGLVLGVGAGILSAGYYLESRKSDYENDNSEGINLMIFVDIMIAYLIFTAVEIAASPIPVYLVGEIGNETSSLIATFLGSANGLMVPIIGPPVGATIGNRLTRKYEYVCKKHTARIELLRPGLGLDTEGKSRGLRYELGIISYRF